MIIVKSLLLWGLTAFLALSLIRGLEAQSSVNSAKSMKIGSVTIGWHKGFSYSGNVFRVFGDVEIASHLFDLQAAEISLTMASGAKKSGIGIDRATAEGDAATGSQVTGHLEDVASGRAYGIKADHAVYVPDPSRPGGGRLDFTGHVTMTIHAPEALASPFIANVAQETVLLGSGSEYPKIQGSAGQATFTPAQGSKE